MMSPLRLHIDGLLFRDSHNREVTLRGINLAGDSKFPKIPDLPNFKSDHFFDGDNVSFVGRPFSKDEARTHFSRLRSWGYNTLRYIFTWEAIEHQGPGLYDEEWIRHTIEILRLAKGYGFYVFLDPHQDCWSRFSGGSGAPLWTLYACGLDPMNFLDTQAALVQNTWPEPAEFPKMIWATNYHRLACQVVLTCFFGGTDFAPKAIIDGRNIQDYLQDHFIGACRHLALRIREAADLENEVVLGWESMNEPNRGLIGWQDLTVVPAEQRLRKGTSPTAWQAILTGSGRACELDTWDFGGLGPYKSGTELVDPGGKSAWLTSDYYDTHYGWSRDARWKLGECLWAQHGVWDPATDEILKKDYFARSPSGSLIDYEYFTNNYFMTYYRKHKEAVRSVFKDAIMFCQPPVLEIPPLIKGTDDDDPNMVYAPHFYDGVTLMTKKWNRYWNVDVLGILRGRYLSPAFAIKLGETAIRNCFRDQLSAIRKEGLDYLGDHPCVFTEIGIPYDMDDKYAYKTGDFSSQTAAMDANHFALEGSRVSGYTLWVYVCTNDHQWGDRWNGEDLSIFSLDDRLLPLHSNSEIGSSDDMRTVLKTPSMTSDPTTKASVDIRSSPGFRAAEAYVRPSPIATTGSIINSSFDLRTCAFQLDIECKYAANEEFPSEIFLPEFHFPKDEIQIEISSGSWTISAEEAGDSFWQKLKWIHGTGQQTLRVKGIQRPQKISLGKEEEEGYFEQCKRSACVTM